MAIKRKITDLENAMPLSVLSFDSNGEPTTILQSTLIPDEQGLESINAGNNVTIDNTDQKNPIVSVFNYIPAFNSASEATTALGLNKFFRFSEANTDNVISPSNTVIGMTSIGGEISQGIGIGAIGTSSVG